MAKRTHYGPNKYAAYHLIFSRWLRHYATPEDYCYVTLGGTELRDVESVSFIDRRLAVDARSYEEDRERHVIAEQTAAELVRREVGVKPLHGNIFEYDRRQNLPHIFFVDLKGICAWADYYKRFGNDVSRRCNSRRRRSLYYELSRPKSRDGTASLTPLMGNSEF